MWWPKSSQSCLLNLFSNSDPSPNHGFLSLVPLISSPKTSSTVPFSLLLPPHKTPTSSLNAPFYPQPENKFTLSSLTTLSTSTTASLKLLFISHLRRRRRQTSDPKIVGSCNGLVCITRGDHIFLWNPATSALKELPYSVDYLINVSFGFDAKSNDLKVIRIYNGPVRESLSREVHVLRLNREAEVYSISSGCWRKLRVDVPYMSINSHMEAIYYVNGVCFWLRLRGVEEIESIVAFDMTQEVFKKTPLPDASVIGDLYETHNCLTVLNESLALILFLQRQNTEKCFDIWVFFEFGVKESWTRLVTIRTFISDLEWPLGFWKNGELFMENTEGQLVLYDPFTQTVRNLHVDDGVKKSFEVFVYRPTSFPIDNM